MKSGAYAEPYRFKPFGSTEVVDRTTGELTPCTKHLCPKAEIIPKKGHHGDDDRASILPESPLQGQLINRAPFYWSGGLGTMIRESSPALKKDLMWGFFIYSNSPDTAVYDVANYGGWLDSWRYSQLSPGDNFIEAGWSQDAYQEHANIMNWALSNEVNGAFNLRLPGAKQYTHDVVGTLMGQFISGEITEDELVEQVATGWNDVTHQRGKLDQLETYRASLSLDAHSEVDLCRLHRDLMDQKDPSVCRKYDQSSSDNLLVSILVPCIIVVIATGIFIYMDRKRKKADCVWQIKPNELTFSKPPEVLGRGTFGLVLLAEYRGTQVAVKRVIPPKTATEKKESCMFASDVEAQSEFSSVAAVASTASAFATSEKIQHVTTDPYGSTTASGCINNGSGLHNSVVSSGVQQATPRRKSSFGGQFFHKIKYGDEYGKLKADFVVEMRYLAKLRHPCVTTVMGAVAIGEPMLVMEMMENGSLYDLLHNETLVLDGDIILPILKDVAQGLRFLHAATPQVIHGDLKAANVLVECVVVHVVLCMHFPKVVIFYLTNSFQPFATTVAASVPKSPTLDSRQNRTSGQQERHCGWLQNSCGEKAPTRRRRTPIRLASFCMKSIHARRCTREKI